MIQPSLRGRLATPKKNLSSYPHVLSYRERVDTSCDEAPSMQMKIGRWEGLYPRIQSAAKHIRCGFGCGYRKIAGLFRSERSAIIGAAQPGVHGLDPSEDRATKKEREQ
jgi:hypothetical protein